MSGVHRGTLAGLHYARSLSQDVTAVYVATDPEAAAAVQEKWGYWGAGVRLVILNSPYRLLIEPLVGYIREVVVSAAAQRGDDDRGAAVRARARLAQPAARADRRSCCASRCCSSPAS